MQLAKQTLKLLMCVVLSCLAHSVHAELLPLQVETERYPDIELSIGLAPSQFLYADKISLETLTGASMSSLIHWPAPTHERLDDETVSLYRMFTLKFKLADSAQAGFRIKYQACNDQGLCFPPQDKTVHFNTKSRPPKMSIVASTETRTKSLHALILSSLIMGCLLGFSPCTYPLIPILLSTLSRAGSKPGQARKLAMHYVIALSLSSALLGALAASLGVHLQQSMQTPWVMIPISGVIITLALVQLGTLRLNLGALLPQASQLPGPTSVMQTWLFGMGSALFLSPCSAPGVLSILTYASQQGSVAGAALALFCLSFAMNVPLMAAAFLGSQCLPRSGIWLERLSQCSGAWLLVLGLDILSVWVDPSLYAFICAVAGGLILRCVANMFSLHLDKYLDPYAKLIIPVTLALMFWLFYVLLQNSFPIPGNRTWIPVKTVSQLKSALHAPKHPSLLQVTADWCRSCKSFDKTLAQSTLIQQHPELNLLKLDLSRARSDLQAVQAYYHLSSPPALILYDARGRELQRFQGALGVDELEQALAEALDQAPD